MAAPRVPRTLPRLTVRGWGLVAAAIVCFVLTQVLRRQELAYLACFLLALPVLALAWVALRRVAISVRRRFTPESGAVNQAVTVTVFLQNWGGLPSPAALWSEGASAPLRPTAPAPFAALPAYTASTLDEPAVQQLHYRLDTRHRGAHEIGPLTLTLADPFGCAVRRVPFGGTDTVLVTPAVFELSRVDLRLSTGDGAEQVSRRLVGAGEQDVIARKYLPGDSIRRVHWPATAKHGELMVRQDDQRNDQDAVVLLDAHSFGVGSGSRRAGSSRPGAYRSGSARSRPASWPDPAFEWAVSAVASVASHLMTEGYGVRLVGHEAAGRGVEDEPVYAAPHGQARALRALASTTTDVLDDPGEFRLAVEEAALTSPDAPPVFAVVSAGSGAERIRDLAGMSSHPVVFVVSEAGAARPPLSAELRQAGWTVVDCTPAEALPTLWKALGEARGLR